MLWPIFCCFCPSLVRILREHHPTWKGKSSRSEKKNKFTTLFWVQVTYLLKVKKSWKDFFKEMFPLKTNKRILLYYYETSGLVVFVYFLEEIEDTKKIFRNCLTFTRVYSRFEFQNWTTRPKYSQLWQFIENWLFCNKYTKTKLDYFSLNNQPEIWIVIGLYHIFILKFTCSQGTGEF